MHPSTATVHPRPPSGLAALPKGVVIALGLMAVAIASLGAALVWRNDAPPVAESLALAAPEVPAPAAADSPQLAYNAPQEKTGTKPPPVQGTQRAPTPKPAPDPAAPATPAPAGTAAAPGTSPSSDTPLPTRPAVVSVCNSCGSVEAVQAVKREGKASGMGAVGGAVVGGAVGNRFGAGSGKTAMTVIGAIGGGLAGNAIEKHAKSETVYRVKVRMEDGTVRTITQAQAIKVGTKVTVQGETLKVSAPPSQTAAPGSQPA